MESLGVSIHLYPGWHTCGSWSCTRMEYRSTCTQAGIPVEVVVARGWSIDQLVPRLAYLWKLELHEDFGGYFFCHVGQYRSILTLCFQCLMCFRQVLARCLKLSKENKVSTLALRCLAELTNWTALSSLVRCRGRIVVDCCRLL